MCAFGSPIEDLKHVHAHASQHLQTHICRLCMYSRTLPNMQLPMAGVNASAIPFVPSEVYSGLHYRSTTHILQSWTEP